MNIKKTIKYVLPALLLIFIIKGFYTGFVMAMEVKAVNNKEKDTELALERSKLSFNAMSVPEMIEYTAPQFSVSPELIKKITYCESGHKVLPHDGHKGTNVTGIWDSTFKGWLPKYEKQTGETLDINSQFDQLKMMAWAFSQGDSYRYQWSTYHAYMKGGKATIWSRYYGKNITVYC